MTVSELIRQLREKVLASPALANAEVELEVSSGSANCDSVNIERLDGKKVVMLSEFRG